MADLSMTVRPGTCQRPNSTAVLFQISICICTKQEHARRFLLGTYHPSANDAPVFRGGGGGGGGCAYGGGYIAGGGWPYGDAYTGWPYGCWYIAAGGCCPYGDAYIGCGGGGPYCW